MNAEKLLDAIGYVRDDFVAEAREKKPRAMRRWRKALAAVACVCLVLLGTIEIVQRFELFTMGAGGGTGPIVDGAYYYKERHDGVYRYVPGEGKEKILSTFWEDGWLVNDYGLYYDCGRSLYVIPHETGKSVKLYRAGLFDSSHIGFELKPDGDLILTVYNKYKEYSYELLLDGRTGEVLETLQQKLSYNELFQRYSALHYQVGERELELVELDNDRYDLLENGLSILPEGVTVGRYAYYLGDDLWFSCQWNEREETMFVVRADGEDELLTIPSEYYYCAVGDWLFCTKEGSVWCYEVSSGESWRLAVNSDSPTNDIFTDGEYLYSSHYSGQNKACWKMVYDEEGRPAALEMVDEDITD